MKKLVTLTAFIVSFYSINAQNVGIGTTTPSEKLDVNGNINVAGQIKVNGNAGTANQVMLKDAGNNLAWGDLSEFKNLQSFDNNSTASSAGANNINSTWTVPAGVTTIFVEAWGGGGGGASRTGGSGGGYISARLTVTPAAIANLTIGAGGSYGNVLVNGIIGGNTSFSIGGAVLSALGGEGGKFGDLYANYLLYQPSMGGGFSATGVSGKSLGYFGTAGGISKTSFVQASGTDYARIINFGDGGDAALLPGSGAKGGYRIDGTTLTQTISAVNHATQNGGGGGADFGNGYYGRGGRIIIRW